MSETEDIRERVSQRYADAATRLAAGKHDEARAAEASACATSPTLSTADPRGPGRLRRRPLRPDRHRRAPRRRLPRLRRAHRVADLHPGGAVVDLGSGAGADVLISVRSVAPRGRAIGVDMTTEMLDLGRRNAAEAGVTNVDFVHGYLGAIPLPDASVDVVLSNCVINLSADKPPVFCRPPVCSSPVAADLDVVADPDMDDVTRTDMARWTGCIAGGADRGRQPAHRRRFRRHRAQPDPLGPSGSVRMPSQRSSGRASLRQGTCVDSTGFVTPGRGTAMGDQCAAGLRMWHTRRGEQVSGESVRPRSSRWRSSSRRAASSTMRVSRSAARLSMSSRTCPHGGRPASRKSMTPLISPRVSPTAWAARMKRNRSRVIPG